MFYEELSRYYPRPKARFTRQEVLSQGKHGAYDVLGDVALIRSPISDTGFEGFQLSLVNSVMFTI